jgi:hypothetical protein
MTFGTDSELGAALLEWIEDDGKELDGGGTTLPPM